MSASVPPTHTPDVERTILATSERLVLRQPVEADAPFVLRLLTDAGWLRWIGDRGVRSLAEARTYIRDGPQKMIRAHGVGLHVAEAAGVAVGLCGLLRRDGIEGVDLGFAFLPDARRRGYATEAGRAVLRHARETLGLRHVAAFATAGNDASAGALTALGFVRDGSARLGEDVVDRYRVAL